MNTFEATNFFFKKAADLLGLNERVQELLLNPHREVKVSIPIEKEDDSAPAWKIPDGKITNKWLAEINDDYYGSIFLDKE